GSARSSARSRARSACSVSDCELTETYSPAAMDMAPATSPASPATMMVPVSVPAAATPTIRLAVETIPSLAPSTAGRSQPIRETRCSSSCAIPHRAGSVEDPLALLVDDLPALGQRSGGGVHRRGKRVRADETGAPDHAADLLLDRAGQLVFPARLHFHRP